MPDPADSAPTLVRLTDLASFSKDFVIQRPFRFHLEGEPEKTFEVMIKPLTEAQLSKARTFVTLAPPKIKTKVKNEASGEEEEIEEDNWADPEFQQKLSEGTSLRIAYVFTHGLPGLKLSEGDMSKTAELIQEQFPPGYANVIEREILRRSTNDLAIVNLANFSVSAGSAQS